MPIYEYHCEACGNEFELLVMGREIPRCPECDSRRLEKRFSTFAPSSGRRASRGRSLPAGGG